MDINFPLILIVLTGITAIAWFYDRLFARKHRQEGQARVWYLEATAPFFPVLFLVLVLRSFVVEPFQIPSGSMIPTLKIGDFILVNKFTYGLRLPVLRTKVVSLGEPKRGDVMVFFPPHDKRYFIKRVIGLPGDEIRIVDNVIYINGEELQQTVLENTQEPGYKVVNELLGGAQHLARKRIPAGRFGRDLRELVPEGHYYMIGDNRDHSHDSRAWGPVPEQNIVGKAFLVWMHWDKFLSFPAFDRAGKII